ncbi:EAL domain-containing protein [Neptuniibacter sp.]|uniref:EAL domain-containing protein n=1 Tax=Neptuniibacter sp. TaxID=1962643 RepID=UPI002601633F|nr:EAL domain-containing protein [Neptuniibacter sp.]MCP4596292.1 EAL domain-containing protein [Neptuniibacter sp.]
MNSSPVVQPQIIKRLENERSFLKTLIQHLPDLIWMKDQDGVYLACNKEFELLFGATEEEILGKTDYDFVEKELADFFRAHDKNAMARQVPTVNEEWVTYASDGREVFLETTKTAIHDDEGAIIGVLGIAHDITERNRQAEQLFSSEKRLKTAQHLSKVGSWELDFGKDQLFWSEQVYAIFELEPAEFSPSYASFLEMVHPDDRALVHDAYHQSVDEGEAYQISHRLLINGKVKYVEEQGEAVYAIDGSPIRFVGTIQDVTERVLYEMKLDRLESMVDHSPDGIFIVDADTAKIVDANFAAYNNLGYTEEEMKQFYVWDVSTAIDDLGSWLARVPGIIAENGVPFEDRHQHKDGHIIPIEITASYIQESDGNFFLTTSRDISERKQAEKKMQHMAYHDLLTNLPNRVLLSDRLHQAISMADRTEDILTICYLDLDEFKPINDRYGHEIGDALLIEFSRRLEKELRDTDTLARLGGDEFILMLTGLDSIYQAEEIIQRVLHTIEEPFEIEKQRLRVSGSIGATIYPHDRSDPDTLIRHADQAMYKAKQAGKNQYCLFDPVEDQKVHAYRNALNEFEQAISENQLTLYYQPRINLQDGTLASVEALVRWNHPTKGFLQPGKFLPLIEGSPLEVALDEWVLKTALDQHICWREEGQTLPISVNISPRNVQQKNFCDHVHTLLEEYPKDVPNNLELEVVETGAIGNTSQVAELMESCTRLGIQFSLDDFGTGYSSLTYFHRLPISILKIDRNFVCDMLKNPQDQDIVEGVIRLAQAINRPVVAEGVESIELGIMLLQLGCQYAQGYGIAKPMPADQIFPWYEKFSRKSSWTTLQNQQFSQTRAYDLNVAIFTHQIWLEKIKDYLHSNMQRKQPLLDGEDCQFSCWQTGIGQYRYGSHSLFKSLRKIHTDVHEHASKMVNLANKGQLDKALSMIEELDEKGTELIYILTKIAQDND